MDRLFDAKAFSKFSRYTADGKQAVGEIKRRSDGTPAENLIIKGNNLIALHSLAKQFKGRVKLIYIDPPYNTGEDSFKYNDKFSHSTWLTFMKNRLVIAKELLKDDGLIFVQCDDKEQAYLKVFMDEVFGRENFINTIAVKMSTPSGVKMSHVSKKIIKVKEHIICFAKNKDLIELTPQYEIKDEYDWEYGFFIQKNNSENVFDWRVENLIDVLVSKNIIKNKLEKPKMTDDNFKNFYLSNSELIWARGRHHNIPVDIYEKSKIDREHIFEYLIGTEKHYAYRGRRLAFLNKTIKNCIDKNGEPTFDISQAICDMWDFIKTSKLFSEGGVEFSNGKKPELIIKTILNLATNENDIVLDYHLGSGTTAAVAHKMNRQYIGIEQMDYIETLAVERLKKVIDGEQGGISKAVNWQGGGEFVYAELAPFNETAKQQILACESLDEIKTLFNELCERYFLKYNVSVDEFSQMINEPEFQSLPLDEQKQMVLEMLDLNQMYVSLSEMDDEQFAGCLNDDDKTLSRTFYQPVKNQAEKKDGE
nr:site-specific DNA-methyltransferase [Haemophilus influenzae]